MSNDRQPTGTPSMVFCSLFVAALSACGGGTGGSGSATTAAIASSDLANASTPVAGSGGASTADSGSPAASIGDDTGGGIAVVSIASADTDASSVGALAIGRATTLALPIAVEGQSFKVPGTVSVRFGVNSTWTTKNVTQSGMCTAAFFGVSGSGPTRSCQVLVPSVMPLGANLAQTTVGLPASENASFFVAGTAKIQYGANGKFVTRSVTGQYTCSNNAFGGDPIWGVVKSCSLATTESTQPAVTATAPAPAPATTTAAIAAPATTAPAVAAPAVAAPATGSTAATTAATTTTTTAAAPVTTTTASAIQQSGLPAKEGDTFFVSGPANVQFGANGSYVTKSFSGQLVCSLNYFGNDPAPNVVKTCSLSANQPAPTAMAQAPTSAPATSSTSLLPWVDKNKIAVPVIGYNSPRVMTAAVNDANPADIGAFRNPCTFSHMSYDDPIVAPGGTGSHLHTFLGNTGTNGNSTAASIANSGNSTCAGGTLNRTSYWVPSMIDTTDGTPQIPVDALMYYKQGYDWVDGKAIKPFPPGLRMIAGNSGSSSAQDKTSFNCIKPDGTTNTKFIPADCPPGSMVQMGVVFPQCWDGVNIDSPDHKSHMAYPLLGCPPTHPVPLMNITYLINYRVGANGTSKWRLSSDNYDKSLPGGYSSHGDWYDGWNADILNTWVSRCIVASYDCHAYLIGDGRMLY